jgi:hypothetical protein
MFGSALGAVFLISNFSTFGHHQMATKTSRFTARLPLNHAPQECEIRNVQSGPQLLCPAGQSRVLDKRFAVRKIVQEKSLCRADPVAKPNVLG